MSNFAGYDADRINLDQVRRVEFCNGGVRITWANGDDEWIDKVTKDGDDAQKSLAIFHDVLRERTAQHSAAKRLVPAAPGYQIVNFYPREEGDPDGYDILGGVWYTPVVAWEIEPEHEWRGEALAIGLEIRADGMDVGEGWQAVLMPNGALREYGNRSFLNLDEWITHIRREWKQSAKRQAAE